MYTCAYTFYIYICTYRYTHMYKLHIYILYLCVCVSVCMYGCTSDEWYVLPFSKMKIRQIHANPGFLWFTDSATALWGQYDEEFTTTANVVTAVWPSGECLCHFELCLTSPSLVVSSPDATFWHGLTHFWGWDLGTGCMRWFRMDLSWCNSQAEGARGDNAPNR